VLLSNDLVIGVQGHAGSGKTTMLSEVKELLGERKIQGLAPSAVAARVLAREAGIPTRTLQYFLTRFADLSDPERLARARAEYGGAVLAVDEASMTGSVRADALLRIARTMKVARVVLVGDTKQLKAVDAGQPYGGVHTRDHRRSNTAIRRDSAAPSTAQSTITRRSPGSTISIRPVAGWPSATTLSDGGLIVAASGSWPDVASTTTGTNRPATPARSDSRNRRRNLKI